MIRDGIFSYKKNVLKLFLVLFSYGIVIFVTAGIFYTVPAIRYSDIVTRILFILIV